MRHEIWPVAMVAVFLVGLWVGDGTLAAVGLLGLLSQGLAWSWSRWALRGVEYQRTIRPERVFAGEGVELTLSLANHKLLPLPWVQVEDQVSARLEYEAAPLAPSHQPLVRLLTRVTALGWFERVRWRYRARCPARGYFRFGGVRLRSGDPFGLYPTQEERPERDHVIVYPRALPLSQLGLPSRKPFGEVRGHERIYEDPSRMIGTRDYRPTDPMKRIDWMASARRQALQARVYESTLTLQVVIALNVDTFPFSWQGTDTAALEAAVSAAASLARVAVEQRLQVGLIANGSLVESDQPVRIPPSRHPQQLVRILEALALVTPMATVPFERLLTVQGSRLPWGVTVVVITAVMTEAIGQALAGLRDRGFRVSLVPAGGRSMEPPAGVELLRLGPMVDGATPPSPPLARGGMAPAYGAEDRVST